MAEGKVIKLFQYAPLTITDENGNVLSEYKLRLRSKDVVQLTKTLGGNPLALLFKGIRDLNDARNGSNPMEMFSVFDVELYVKILHASLQCFHHGISLDDAFDIYDEYVDNGGNNMDFLMTVLMDVFRASGLMPDEDTTKEDSDVSKLTEGINEGEEKNE